MKKKVQNPQLSFLLREDKRVCNTVTVSTKLFGSFDLLLTWRAAPVGLGAF